MVRKFVIGESLVYCGESAAVPVRVVGHFEDDGGLGLPIYWVSGEGCCWACAENYLEKGVL